MWTLTIDGVLPMSMNERERVSHWTRRRELQDFTRTIAALAQNAGVPQAKGKRRVTLTIVKGKRSRRRDDPANRDSRAKSVLDALVANGLLRDDSDEWLDWPGVVETKADVKQTIITLEDK